MMSRGVPRPGQAWGYQEASKQVTTYVPTARELKIGGFDRIPERSGGQAVTDGGSRSGTPTERPIMRRGSLTLTYL